MGKKPKGDPVKVRIRLPLEAEADEDAAEPMSYSLAEVRNGTGWPKDVRFIAQSGSEADG
ncbi:gp80 [Mycobacterium phage Corndog]|uniref:Uncharacterized protein n=1 Tax=Mycobacterium phage Corndog TaxID=205875 RepID=Q856L4_BPMCO|nr:gp80 [Mycobacterium phage Corndog]AAN02012.1 hypothetical protein PBI_CORNDOG_80 [Mycobacterium phage Corndog]